MKLHRYGRRLRLAPARAVVIVHVNGTQRDQQHTTTTGLTYHQHHQNSLSLRTSVRQEDMEEASRMLYSQLDQAGQLGCCQGNVAKIDNNEEKEWVVAPCLHDDSVITISSSFVPRFSYLTFQART